MVSNDNLRFHGVAEMTYDRRTYIENDNLFEKHEMGVSVLGFLAVFCALIFVEFRCLLFWKE